MHNRMKRGTESSFSEVVLVVLIVLFLALVAVQYGQRFLAIPLMCSCSIIIWCHGLEVRLDLATTGLLVAVQVLMIVGLVLALG